MQVTKAKLDEHVWKALNLYENSLNLYENLLMLYEKGLNLYENPLA